MSAHETIICSPVATPPSAAPSRIPALRRVRPGLITDWHLGLLAIVYIRQSTAQQILDHRESRERQYELVNYAVALGWPRDRILIIDDDQGLTGTTADNRSGFLGLRGVSLCFLGRRGVSLCFLLSVVQVSTGRKRIRDQSHAPGPAGDAHTVLIFGL